MLKVRIVEMQRSVTKQMGLDLSAIGELGDSTVSLVNQVGPTLTSGFNANGAFNNTGGGDLSSLSGALSALESVGLVRTLAEPTLTAISGETANFLAGGEIPIFSGATQDQNGQLVRSFEFKPFGVSLGFTPVVLSEGRISLSISTEVSEPTVENAFVSDSGESVLGIRVRRANTVVEMPAGGSLVIAGLIREETRSTVDGTPGLKDVPGLGALFRGRDTLSTQTEIVIMVTPKNSILTACVLISGLALTACATPNETFGPVQLRNTINVAESIERLELYTRPNGLELSARDELAVAQFLDGYAQSGEGALYINRPANAVSGLGTQQAEAVIRGLMAQGGLNPNAIQTGQYPSRAGAPAPVIVSYRTLRAIPQDCRQLGELTNTFGNEPHGNFGCFQSANIAAMITDPRQLLEPYALGQPNAQRRQVVYDQYIQGNATASQVNPGQLVGTNN